MASPVVPRSAARLRRPELRVVIELAGLLAGVVGTVGVVQRAGQRTPMLVMARDVPAGQVIDSLDVRLVELGLAPRVAVLGRRGRGEWSAGWRACRWPPGRSSAQPRLPGRHRWRRAGADERGGGTPACRCRDDPG
jgi:hypothetical protein